MSRQASIPALLLVLPLALVAACHGDEGIGMGGSGGSGGGDGGGDTDTDSDSDSDSDSDTDSDTDTDSDSDSDTDSDTGSGSASDCGLDVHEPFTSSSLPPGWLIDDIDNDGYSWDWTAVQNDIGNGSSGGYWVVDSSAVSGIAWNERLSTAMYQRGDCAEVTVSFNHLYDHVSGDASSLEIYVDDGPWTALATWDADADGEVSLDVSSQLEDDSSFRLRFTYSGTDASHWKIDDVRIRGSGSL